MNDEMQFVVSHWVLIRAWENKALNQIADILYWHDLPAPVRMKWSWYFRYRAALMQVQHPRLEVEFLWGHHTPSDKVKYNSLENRIKDKKRRITIFRNRLSDFIAEYQKSLQLFPVEETPEYKGFTEQIKKKQGELETMEQELQKLKDNMNDSISNNKIK